ncbi:heat shock 70 kDa protein 12A-like isoform X1 [Mytilus galloprovincialis]|uniref:heat shock 70 kDa protein 12A-like isoform X1 n=1 Tax=Mytilus galloprovincialis TaxID=29158 RepID=UPI003F7C0464
MGGKQSTSAEPSRPSTAPPASRGSDKKPAAKTPTKTSQDDSKTTTTSRQPSEKTKTPDKTTSAEPSKRPSKKTESPPPRSRSADLSKRTRTSASEAKQDGANIVKDIENKKKNKLLVAAIDFGTTYSGYACLTRDEFENNKGDNSKIYCPHWEREAGLSYKAPTSVLFRPNKTFHSFGFEAEKYYHENSDNIDFKEWYFYKHFKMKLYTDKDELTQDTIIEDSREAGNRMKAVDVFAAVIKYFKDQLLKYFKDRHDDKEYLNNNDIHWVITVPAIWDLKAKQFMKDAALKAGISGDQLTLALEPEAASLYCRKVPVSVEITKDGGKAIAAMQNGSQYIVFDQGGGTTDITVHEVTGQNTLKEIHQACGGHYGGTTVNAEFYKFWTTLLSGPVIKEIRDKHPSEYFDFMTAFEHKKTSFSVDEKSMITLRIPVVWMEVFKDNTDETLEEAILDSAYNGKVTMQKDKLRMKYELFRKFFDYSINNVLRVFEDLFKKPTIANIRTVLAVGGYSESPVLINAIKEKFPKLTIIVPKDPGLAVLKGAVLYGFEPQAITERVSQYTYGVAMQKPYDPDLYDESKISTIRGHGGKRMVDDVFDKHIEIGKVCKIGEFEQEHDYYPLVNEHIYAYFEFYASELKSPKYTTDPKCQMIGTFSVKISKAGKIFLKLNASGTEILGIVREEETGKESRAYFSLM